MGRPHRAAEGGLIYHALNRANGRLTIFDDAGDYDAFLRVLDEAVGRYETRVLAYCVMPNHSLSCSGPVRMASCRDSCAG